MDKTKLSELSELLREWGILLGDNVTDTAPGQAVDIDAVVFAKTDYVERVRAYRPYLDGYAMETLDRALSAAALMNDEHSVLSAEQAIQAAYDETMRLSLRGKMADGVRQDDHQADDPAAIWSKPMSKTRMMTALTLDSIETFNAYAGRMGIRSINRKTHQIRLDKMSPRDRERIEKA